MGKINEKSNQKLNLPNPLPKPERERLRKDLKTHIKFSPKTPPKMMIKVSDLLELINNSNSTDYLNFFLATYRTQADVDRYNSRVGTNYDLGALGDRPTLLVGLQKDELSPGDVYDLAVIKPPPYDL